DEQTILINHWPLRRDLAILPAIPRFCVWCGTRATEDWATRYRAKAVVYGHLHIPRTHHRHHVRFEEVSLGYPRQYDRSYGLTAYLREILPGPSTPTLLIRHSPAEKTAKRL
ncbi:MAG: metallophosphoesterase, partial [Deltaproteobacteria bacterium]|nr:metallophosphoesterase [Deltaproteobacteria bacterium]